jgi:endonuclease/exonuclease/phosphatase family metal-dependent hydrolase
VSELVPGLRYEEFRDAALAHASERSFRASPFYARHGAALERLLTTPRIDRRATAAGGPGDRGPEGRLRVVHWNIEKGKRLDAVRGLLTRDPELRQAQVYTLNEVDVGMARSASNADVARELAEALGCHAVFVPSYLECTKGPGEEGRVPGENARGLHGLAVLSRLPVLGASVRLLPSCFDYFDFFEKRFGSRQALYVLLEWRGREILVATTHLEVRYLPSCRARQLRSVLDGLEDAGPRAGPPAILTGDWNTNSFRRGGLRNSMLEFVRIVRTPPARLDEELVRPYQREPLFADLEARGFAVEPFNDRDPTGSQLLGKAEDLAVLPRFLADLLSRRFRLRDRVIRMRLDWIAARGFVAAGEPRTIPPTAEDGGPASDHALLLADLALGRSGDPDETSTGPIGC